MTADNTVQLLVAVALQVTGAGNLERTVERMSNCLERRLHLICPDGQLTER